VVAAACLVDPGGTAELAHRDDEGVLKHAPVFEVFGELEDDVVEVGDDHLVDLVVEDVAVPRHAIGDHDEGSTFLDKGAGEEGVLAESAGAVALAVGLRDALEVEKVGAAHEAIDAFKGGIPRTGGGGFAIVLVLFAEELAEGFAGLVIVFGDGVEFVGVGNLKFAADADGGVFGTKPSGPVACFEAFEFVSFGTGVEEDEVGNFGFELPELLGEDGADGWSGERRARGVAALKEVDSLGVFLGLRLHRTDDGEFVGDGGALGEKLGKVSSGDLGGDAFEGTTGDGPGFGIPGFELAGPTAEPEKNAVLLFLLGDFGEGGSSKESGPTHGGDGSGGEALEEFAAMQVVVR